MEHTMIQHLSDDVRAHIRTGVTLTTFAQAVEELVLNSIDAKATSVAVRVDLPCFKIQVVDNGIGITRHQFELIGERYSTSKCHTVEDLENLKYFGYRGEALASLKNASSFLEVISRPRSSSITLSKCFQNGKAHVVTESPVSRPSAGSTVTAHGIFYNLPVRRKRLNKGLEMERIRYRLAGIALMWPKISVSLRDDSVGHVILQTRKCSGMAASFSHIFTPARAKGLMDVSIEKDGFKLFGIVSKESYSRKDLQFVFVNKRLVLKSSIHRQINKILGRSLILRRKGLNLDVTEKLLNSGDISSGSPTKQAERFGIFAINVECPYSAYDITFDPAKTLVEFRDWPKLIHLLQDMLYGHLRKENLLSFTEPSLSVSPLNTIEDDDDDDDEVDEDENDESSIVDTVSQENYLKSTDNELEKQTDQVKQCGKSISAASTQNALFSKPTQRPGDKQGDKSSGREETVTVSFTECQPSVSLLKPGLKISKNESVHVNRHTNFVDIHEENNLHRKNAHSPVSTKTQISRNYSRDEEELDRVKRSFLQDEVIGSKTTDNQPLLTATNKHVREKQWQDELEVLIQVSKCRPTESEEVIVQTKSIQGTTRKEITLGNAVHYSSTLQSLRDSNPTAIAGTSKVSEIITNTLQQLKRSVKKASRDLADPYKTPERLIKRKHGHEEDPPETKMQKRQIQTEESESMKTTSCLSNQLEAVNTCNTCTNSHVHALEAGSLDSQKNHETNKRHDLSTIYISTTENRCLGKNDRAVPQKRASLQKLTHASKLGKLMRGEKIAHQGALSNEDDQADNDEAGDSRHVEFLKSFKYSRPLQHRQDLPGSSLSLEESASSVKKDILTTQNKKNPTNILERTDSCSADFTPEGLSNSSQSALPNVTRHSVTSSASNYDHRQPSLPSSDNKDSFNCPSSNDMCRTSRNQQGTKKSESLTLQEHGSICCSCKVVCKSSTESSSRDLPFSMYKQSIDNLQTSSSVCPKSPRVSFILSVPVEPVKSTGLCKNNNSSATGYAKSSNHHSNLPGNENNCLMKSHDITNKAGDFCFQQSQGFQISNRDKCPENSESEPQISGERLGKKISESSHSERNVLSPILQSQGFSPNFLHSKDTETSSDTLSASPASQEKRLANKTVPMIMKNTSDMSGYNSTGFSPYVSASFERNEDASISSHQTKNSNWLVENAVDRGIIIPGFLSSDCELYEKGLTESATQSLSTNTEETMETHSSHLPKEGISELSKESSDILNDHQVMKPKPQHTCSNSQSSYFDQLTQSNSTSTTLCQSHIPQPVEITKKLPDFGITLENVQINSNSTVLPDDSLKDQVDCNTVPETDIEQDNATVMTTLDSCNSKGIISHSEGLLEPSDTLTLSYKCSGPFKDTSTKQGVISLKRDICHAFETRSNDTEGSSKEHERGLCHIIASNMNSTCSCIEPSLQAENDNSHDGNLWSNCLSQQTIPCAQQKRSLCPDNPSNENETDSFPFLSTASQLTIAEPNNRITDKDSESLFEDLNKTQSSSILNTVSSLTSHSTTTVSESNIQLSPNCRQEEEASAVAKQDSDLEVIEPVKYTWKKREMNDNEKKEIVSMGVQPDAIKYCSQMSSLITKVDNSKVTQDPQKKQTEIMSSAGDNILLMVDAAEGCEEMAGSGLEKRLVSGDTSNSNFSIEKTQPQYKQHTELERHENTLSKGICEMNLASQQRISITLSGAFRTSSDPSPLSLLRRTTVPKSLEDDDTRITAQKDSNSKDKQINASMAITVTDQKDVPVVGCSNDKRMIESDHEEVTQAIKRPIDQEISERKGPLLYTMKDQSEMTKDRLHLPSENQKTENASSLAKDRSPTEGACWKEVTDSETGIKMYINNLSGHTVSERQWSEMSSQVQMEMLALNPTDMQMYINCSKSSDSTQQEKEPTPLSASGKQALQAMVAKHIEDEDTESTSKWRAGKYPVYDKEIGADISSLMTKWKNPVFLNYKEPAPTADICPAGFVARSCFNSLSLVEFTKDMLKNVKVIGQLDNKFIACIIEKAQDIHITEIPKNSALLVLFDQHAVHERIRLEYFTEDSYEVENNVKTDRIKRLEISPPQPITMDQDDVRIMKAFSKEFDRVGIKFHADKTCRRTVHIKSVPACIGEKDSSETKKNKSIGRTDRHIENLIKEHICLLKSTNGACGRLPLAIHKVLCSQACHGAVKFGDELTLQECRDLLSSLANCKLPFQCAHGRPSVAPLVDLTALEKELHSVSRKPNLWNISQHLSN